MKKPLVSNRVLVIDDKTGTSGKENYVRVGKGFTNFTKASNSTIDQKFYIDESGYGNSEKTGMQTIYSLTGDRVVGDPANDFIVGCYEKLGDDVITTAVQYDEYAPVASEAGSYEAKKFTCMVNCTNDGSGDGGGILAVEAEIHQNGKAIEGTYNPTTKTFTAKASK
ncbi:MAG: hypothetical protein J5982_03315 [Bacilli bacterium]|nr:hypothetical protein [Bacilli bacterium]